MDKDALAKIIWNKPFSEVTESEAAAVVQQYPYFSAARFIHLEKLDSNSKSYSEQYQKAILYYHNPTTFPLFLHPPTDVHFDKPTDTKAEISPWPNAPKPAEQLIPQPVEKIETKALPDIESAKEEILFEPFHTVDYFASQGIKPSADDVPKDKFGKQLKSFTDWLKTMKKLPATELTKDSGAEKNVEHLAAHSVADASVITESMAEVWLKQGNGEKAIETYNKLSLQNPAKSAYFAAKIERITSQKK